LLIIISLPVGPIRSNVMGCR